MTAHAKYVAQQFGWSERQAIDYLKKSAEARIDPEKTRLDIYKAALSASGGRADRAASTTEQAMRYLQGGAEALAQPDAEPPSRGVLQVILDAVGMGDSTPQTAMAAPGGSGQEAQPRSAEEFQALPSGTVFIDPEGNRRVKP